MDVLLRSRCLYRISHIKTPVIPVYKVINNANQQILGIRQGSFIASTLEDSPDAYTEVEVSKSPEEWKFVERLMRPKHVPQPVPKDKYPSGWKPPSDTISNLEYFVPRSKNHMLPVYLQVSKKGQRRITEMKHIKGNIWLMDQELKKFLEEKHQRKIASQVHEVFNMIRLKGDYVRDTQNWLLDRGF